MKHLVAAILLRVLGAGFLVLYRRDPRMREQLGHFVPGSTLQIRAWDGGPVLSLRHDSQGSWQTSRQPQARGPKVLEVAFRSPRSALRALLGLQSVTGAFLENRLVVRGDVMVALPLVRAVNLVEAHLFPLWWTKGLGPLPRRDLGFWATWVGAVALVIHTPSEGIR